MQNIRAKPQITFSVGTREQPENAFATTQGVATIISLENQPELTQQVRQVMDAKYSWSDGLTIQLRKI